jgi:hypothetical protein
MVWASNRIPNLSDEPKADYPTSVIPVPGATNIQVVLFPADSLGVGLIDIANLSAGDIVLMTVSSSTGRNGVGKRQKRYLCLKTRRS